MLCDGLTSEASYFPLKIGDSWTYGNEVHKIDATETYGGNTYFDMSIGDQFSPYHNYFRSANDGVYEYITADSKEYLFIPSNPTVNQEWDYRVGFGVGKRKVISLTATVKTSKCEYKNVMQINEYYEDGSSGTIYYYKKGLGMIRYTVFSTKDLTAVTLK